MIDFTKEELEWILFKCKDAFEMGCFLGDKEDIKMAESIKAKIEAQTES